MNEIGWARASIVGGEQKTIQALEAVSDQLGSVIQGRGGSDIETIAPTPRERAHRRSLSAAHGFEPLPLHVELSHRLRPCQYVAFGCLDPGIPSVTTTILDHRTMDFSAEERALLRNAVVLVRSGRRSFYWSWLSAVAGISQHDRLAYLVPRFNGGGCPAAIEKRLLDRLAADYLRPERPSWAACVRRVKVFAENHGIALPHARTLWRRLCKLYDGPTMALHRGEQLPAWLLRRLPANDR